MILKFSYIKVSDVILFFRWRRGPTNFCKRWSKWITSCQRIIGDGADECRFVDMLPGVGKKTFESKPFQDIFVQSIHCKP